MKNAGWDPDRLSADMMQHFPSFLTCRSCVMGERKALRVAELYLGYKGELNS